MLFHRFLIVQRHVKSALNMRLVCVIFLLSKNLVHWKNEIKNLHERKVALPVPNAINWVMILSVENRSSVASYSITQIWRIQTLIWLVKIYENFAISMKSEIDGVTIFRWHCLNVAREVSWPQTYPRYIWIHKAL